MPEKDIISMFRALALAAVAAAAIAAPAAAITTTSFNFGGGSGTPASLAVARPGLTITATARQFTAAPGTLTSLSDLGNARQLRLTAPGIGVNGGGSNEQVDANLAQREALILTGSRNFFITGFTLSNVDPNDTFQLYGINGQSLVNLGFPGIIRANAAAPNQALSLLGGNATGAFTSANGGTQLLNLNVPTGRFSGFVLTTRESGIGFIGGDGQGYRLNTLVGGVPEPESWAMLITGFGLVGAVARRRGQRALAA
jgi:hypothetical protein